ncbi:Nucleolar protein 10 [Dictyocoela muelleri]|nr:Nucleolar protein 10 [Dictyocoela muelleri]
MTNFKKINLFETPSHSISCNNLQISGKYLLTCGTYKPKIKIYDLEAQSKLLERVVDTEPLKIISLDEHKKLSILRNDNFIEFHTKSGFYDKIGVNSSVRDILFDMLSGKLMIGGSKYSTFDFKKGFIQDIYEPESEISCMTLNPIYNIITLGTSNSILFFDHRQKGKIKMVKISDKLIDQSAKIFILKNQKSFSEDKKFNIDKNDDFNDVYSDNENYKNAISSIDTSIDGLNLVFVSNFLFHYDIRNRKIQKFVDTEKSIIVKFNNKNILLGMQNDIYLIKDLNCDEYSDRITTKYKIHDFCFNGGVLFVGGENENVDILFSKEMGNLPNYWDDLAF